MKTIRFWSMMLAVLALPFVTSCGSDDNDEDNVDTSPISIYSDGEKVIEWADTITSSNSFVAYATGNKVSAFHVGETSLLVNGKHTISIKVKPLYNLYDDPVNNWGCTVDYVKSHQTQGTLSDKSTETTLTYENAGGASYLVYMFENGKLASIGAIVSTNHASTYGKYLAERYIMTTYYEGSKSYFIGIDGLTSETSTTFIRMEVSSANYITTIYVPVSSAKSRETRSIDNQDRFNRYAKKLLEVVSE